MAERLAGYGAALGAFDRFALTATEVAVDGDLVVVEALGRGEGPGTFLYLQTAVLVFRVGADGRFASLREYIDHQEVEYFRTYLERFPQCQG